MSLLGNIFKACNVGSSSTVRINGRTYRGRNVSVINGEVYIDGKKAEDGDLTQEQVINVHIEGDVGSVETGQGDVTVTGAITGDARTSQGSIKCGGDIGGDAKTSQGSIDCRGDIRGSAKTRMGSIDAQTIHGGIKT
jgi:DUF4097 and DUF4098 domain-containing protein YvlB